MADPEARITLRLPVELRDGLQAASEKSNRSMNGEIVDRLNYSFDAETSQREMSERLVFLERRTEMLDADLQARRKEAADAQQLRVLVEQFERELESKDSMLRELHKTLEAQKAHIGTLYNQIETLNNLNTSEHVIAHVHASNFNALRAFVASVTDIERGDHAATFKAFQDINTTITLTEREKQYLEDVMRRTQPNPQS